MKKATKGALAAAAAGSLLLGGAGTLAYWTDNVGIGGADINSGEITMSPLDCATDALHDWEFAPGVAFTNQVVVPGDSLKKVCAFDLTLAGDNIGAALDVADATFEEANGLTGDLVVTPEFTISDENGDVVQDGNGDPASSVDAAGVYTVQVSIDVELPLGTTADNDSNVEGGLTAALEAITVTATQA